MAFTLFAVRRGPPTQEYTSHHLCTELSMPKKLDWSVGGAFIHVHYTALPAPKQVTVCVQYKLPLQCNPGGSEPVL